MPTQTANKDIKPTAQTITSEAPPEPHKLVQNLVDKKIRNLEKRKSRLNELQQLSAKGQALEPEQQKAVKKLDQVVEMIDLMKDLSKTITAELIENAKLQKKLHKRDLLDKQTKGQQQEVERVKTIVKYQDILGKFETTVRQDFSNGTNGAIKLTEDQLKNLDTLYAAITDMSNLDTTAEKLMALADGKAREAWPGVTFQQLKELMNSVVETKYFESEKTSAISTSAPTNTTTTATVKPDESTKIFPRDNTTTQNENKTTPVSNQFHSVQPNDFNSAALTQIQSQFAPGISFMTGNSLDKDPAVVAVASVGNNFSTHVNSYQTYSESFISSPHPEANSATLNQQKTTTYDNTTSMSTIPTQTFTNQQFAALIPSNTPGYAVPVTLTAPVPITGLVAELPDQLIAPQNFGNHQNFMTANDKHSPGNTGHPSHDRPNNFNNEEHRNRNRNRPDNKKNMNGIGNRGPRNANKGQSYGQNPTFNNNNSKYDNQMNGQNYNNSFGGEKTNSFRGDRNRGGQPHGQRPPRSDGPKPRPERNNQNYTNANFGATAAK